MYINRRIDPNWPFFESVITGDNPLSSTKQTFPRYNVVQVDNTTKLFEIALAGYKKEELSVELIKNLIVITGKQKKEEQRNYLIKGLTTKDFSISFGVEPNEYVQSVTFVDGVLSIETYKEIQQEKSKKFVID